MKRNDDCSNPERNVHPKPCGAVANTPGILDAVEDQNGTHWIRFGTSNRSIWFSLEELQLAEKDVFGRLSGPGMTFLTHPTRTKFKKQIESHSSYRPALVASHPGWLGKHYVFGDGEVIAPPDDACEVLIAFSPNPKFTPTGKLKDWQEDVGPVVMNQPLPLFAAAYSFVGPILRFAPAHIHNPEVEFVGERECGKSIVVAFGASIWAGDPESDVGGAETWDLTINALDTQRVAHADCLLPLDEVNLAGNTRQDQSEVIGKGVFKLAARGGRKRYADKAPVPNVRHATLSSSNVPLAELVPGPDAVRAARQSRMITIQIPKDHAYGVLHSVPEGFANCGTAMDRLRSAVDQNYGRAGRAFIRQLVDAAAADEQALRRRIEKLTRCLAKLREGGAARDKNTLAVTFAAGMLARKWGGLPKAWGPLLRSILQVYRLQGDARAAPSGLERIRDYRRVNRKNLVKISAMKAPYSERDFARTAGFLRPAAGGVEILIPSGRFQQEFPDYRELMRSLKKAGKARTEGGKRPKLTIKAPSRVCSSGRVYCIRISAESADSC